MIDQTNENTRRPKEKAPQNAGLQKESKHGMNMQHKIVCPNQLKENSPKGGGLERGWSKRRIHQKEKAKPRATRLYS